MKNIENFIQDKYFERYDNTKPGQFYPTPISKEHIEDIKDYVRQLLSEYTERIVENVDLIYVGNGLIMVDNESINSTLPEFLKEVGL